jgi:hypothetical protein
MSDNWIDINDIRAYKAKSDNKQNCYKFTHLIKINNNNNIIVNDNPKEYIPVLTLSTNTDYKRDLVRDSFAILKFIEDNNDLTDNCVESFSRDNKKTQLNITLLKLANISQKINNGNKDLNLLYEYSRLIQIVKRIFRSSLIGGLKNELNVEIYEYMLKNYPNVTQNVYTESISSSSEDECGYINFKYTASRLNNDIGNIRSCDLIKGDLDQSKISLIPSNDPSYDFRININGSIINSEDLIKFGNEFPAKINNRIKVKNTSSYNMNTIYLLYDQVFINYIFINLKPILLSDWSNVKIDEINDDDDMSLIKIIKPNKNEKFIIFGDFHGSYQTFIRHLLRFRKMNVLDENCRILNNYHIIFLGDIVDRGAYGYEICIIIYMLIILNPKNVHYIRGNHEERDTNKQSVNIPLLNQLIIQFGKKDGEEYYWHNINRRMRLQSSAILIRNPNNRKYIYLSHGGLPTNITRPFKIVDNFRNFDTKFNIIINNSEFGYINTIRWNDLARESLNTTVAKKSHPPEGRGILVGDDLLREAQSRGIELFIRGHNDQKYNTKLLPI